MEAEKEDLHELVVATSRVVAAQFVTGIVQAAVVVAIATPALVDATSRHRTFELRRRAVTTF